MALNNIIAAPSFATWIQGAPLDIDHMLYGDDAKPNCDPVNSWISSHDGDCCRDCRQREAEEAGFGLRWIRQPIGPEQDVVP